MIIFLLWKFKNYKVLKYEDSIMCLCIFYVIIIFVKKALKETNKCKRKLEKILSLLKHIFIQNVLS